jgi:hypothetical protein
MTQNVVVERLTLLLRIQEVPGPNFGPDVGYAESLHGFPQSVWKMPGYYLKLGYDRFFPDLSNS